MAVSKMKLVSIIGRLDSLDNVLFACGRSGVSQPDDALSFFSDTKEFSNLHEDNPYTEPLNRLESSVSRLGGAANFIQHCELSADKKDGLFSYVERFSRQVGELTRQRAQLAMKIESLNKDSEQFEHFIGLGINLDDVLHCRLIKVRFGRLPKESYQKLNLYDENPYVLFFPGRADANYYWGVYFAPLDYAGEIDRIFSSLYFERLRIPSAVGSPSEIVEHLRAEREQAEKDFARIDGEIAAFWQKEKPECERVLSTLQQFNYYFSARRFAARYRDKFILTGWIPAKDEKKFCLALDAVDGVDYTIEKSEADKHHSPPIQLRNPSLFKPFEFFVGMYGLPGYREIDPTIFFGITYTILFGIMFADLGQGLCVAVIGWLMWKYKRMAVGKVLVPCGISAGLFGMVFGSVFGFEHALDPLYTNVFGLSQKPIEVMHPSTTIQILVVSAGIGLFLIVVSMLLNIYSGLKRRDFETVLFSPNGVAGLVFYTALILGLVAQLLTPFRMNPAYILLLIVLPVVLMFFREPLGGLIEGRKDWKPESWGEFIVQNFFEIFEVMLAYMSNTMSFLRVGAFVLVHAGMMMAVFVLAGLFGPVGYTVTVLLGNGLVMVMEALLVAIQVMRLEYYEMFSRYYIGDGRPFHPLTAASGQRVFSEEV